MAKVSIGVDPHKLSATIEVVDEHETVLATGRFSTDKAGYAAMRKTVSGWPDRVWAVEGSNGAGRPLAQRLLADGEHVVDVPANSGTGTAVRHRPQPQDRCPRRARGRRGRCPHTGAAGAVLRRRARGAADARRPTRGADTTGSSRHRLRGSLSELTPARRRRTSPPVRPRPSWLRCVRGTSPGRPAAGIAAEQLAELVAVEPRIEATRRGAEGDRHRAWVHADGHARRRTRRRRPDPGRRRRRGPVRRPQPVRVLDRHRTTGRLLR